MNEEQLIATLQACYFGDKGAFNKILKEYKKLQEENQQLKDNWDKLKEWLKEQDIFLTEIPAFTKEIGIEHKIMSICYENILDKMEEILKGE